MKEIECNKHAWSQISYDHYLSFKQSLTEGRHKLTKYIQKEVGDLTGKRVIHLQCNTGADTILLAKMGASEVVGVDLVPDNVHYATKLADDLGVTNVKFIESDIMKFAEIHNEKYDVVFVSEGAIGWLPDLKVWGKTIRHLLNDDGYFYIFDQHPFFSIFDEDTLANEEYTIRYPYFSKQPDMGDTIGGYATETKGGVKSYFWMHTVSEIINSLSQTGMCIDFFNEYTELFYNSGGLEPIEGTGLYNYDFNDNKFPMSFSLKASVYKG